MVLSAWAGGGGADSQRATNSADTCLREDTRVGVSNTRVSVSDTGVGVSNTRVGACLTLAHLDGDADSLRATNSADTCFRVQGSGFRV